MFRISDFGWSRLEVKALHVWSKHLSHIIGSIQSLKKDKPDTSWWKFSGEVERSASTAAQKALYHTGKPDDSTVSHLVSKESIIKILQEEKLCPNYEELDKTFRGDEIITETQEIIHSFQPRYIQDETSFLEYDMLNRAYKLVRLKFHLVEGHEETSKFFKESVFGLIVDATICLDALPKQIYGHYGSFKVEYKVLHDNLSISKPEDHLIYLDFTHRVWVNCLKIPGVLNLPNFRYHCRNYFVILDPNGKINFRLMRKTFREGAKRCLNEGNIVKLGPDYANYKRLEKSEASLPHLLLVRKVTNLNITSVVPGRRSVTFKDLLSATFGPRCEVDHTQKVLEVMPVTPKYSQSYKITSKSDVYSSTSLFYPAQILEFVAGNPDFTFQAHNLPELTYRIHLSSSVQKLDEEFKRKTKSFRCSHLKTKPDPSAKFSSGEDGLPKKIETVHCKIKPPIQFKPVKPFKERNRVVGLLEALTSCSAQENHNLEVLEHLGDAYLKYVVSVILFNRLDFNAGLLSGAKASLLSNEHFYHLALKNELGEFAITSPFEKHSMALLLGCHDVNVEKSPKNEMRKKDLADLVESIIGANLLYQGEHEAILAIKWLGVDIFKVEDFAEFNEKAVAFKPSISPAQLEHARCEKLKTISRDKLFQFEEILSYRFQDPSFLLQALTHGSYKVEIHSSYERLEFLGDAILDFLVTLTLVSKAINKQGQLRNSRCQLVNKYAFAKLALKYQYNAYIQQSKDLCLENECIGYALDEDPAMNFLEQTEYNKHVKRLKSVFKAVSGAIYLDSGCSLDAVWSVYYPMMKDAIEKEVECPTMNVVGKLYEAYPGPDRIEFIFRTQKKSSMNIAELRIKDVGSFEGKGPNQKLAKMRAAAEALKNLPPPEELKRLHKEFFWKARDCKN